MTPDEPTPCPENGIHLDAPDRDADASSFGDGDARDFDAGELHGEADRDDGWQILEPVDDDRYDECHDEDRDDGWADHAWDRYDGYESLHQRHAPHDWPIFDQPVEDPGLDAESPDPLDQAEREAEAADPEHFRLFQQDRDEWA